MYGYQDVARSFDSHSVYLLTLRKVRVPAAYMSLQRTSVRKTRIPSKAVSFLPLSRARQSPFGVAWLRSPVCGTQTANHDMKLAVDS